MVNAESANIIATLLALKKEVDIVKGQSLKLTLVGAAEAHLLAREIGQASVGVILVPSRSFPVAWQQKQMWVLAYMVILKFLISRFSLPGPPLTEESVIATLIANNVTVGIGVVEKWTARNTRFDAAWVRIEAITRLNR